MCVPHSWWTITKTRAIWSWAWRPPASPLRRRTWCSCCRRLVRSTRHGSAKRTLWYQVRNSRHNCNRDFLFSIFERRFRALADLRFTESIKKLGHELEPLKNQVSEARDEVKGMATSLRVLLSEHHKILVDVRSLLKSMTKVSIVPLERRASRKSRVWSSVFFCFGSSKKTTASAEYRNTWWDTKRFARSWTQSRRSCRRPSYPNWKVRWRWSSCCWSSSKLVRTNQLERKRVACLVRVILDRETLLVAFT